MLRSFGSGSVWVRCWPDQRWGRDAGRRRRAGRD